MFLTHEMVVLPFLCSTFLISLAFLCNFHFRKSATSKKKDIDRQKQLNDWEETSPFFERNIPPHEIFALFLKD